MVCVSAMFLCVSMLFLRYTHRLIHTHIYSHPYTCTYTYKHAHIHVCLHIDSHIHIYMSIQIHVHTHIHACVYVDVRACILLTYFRAVSARKESQRHEHPSCRCTRLSLKS